MNNKRKWDVVVLGGGVSGCMAAFAAAKQGASTLLIEKYGFLGGSLTPVVREAAEMIENWIKQKLYNENNSYVYRRKAVQQHKTTAKNYEKAVRYVPAPDRD